MFPGGRPPGVPYLYVHTHIHIRVYIKFTCMYMFPPGVPRGGESDGADDTYIYIYINI